MLNIFAAYLSEVLHACTTANCRRNSKIAEIVKSCSIRNFDLLHAKIPDMAQDIPSISIFPQNAIFSSVFGFRHGDNQCQRNVFI